MPRVKRGTTVRKRHKKLRKSAKGYVKSRRSSVKRATEARLHAKRHAQRHRKTKKREMRGLWVTRINAALKQIGGVSYSAFIHHLELKNVGLDRKTLAYLADQAPDVFRAVVKFTMSK